MDLDELLAFKPQKKRSLMEDDFGEDEKPPSSKRRGGRGGMVATGNGGMSRGAEVAGGQSGLSQLNGVSDEEKLKILQSLDDDEEDTGEGLVWRG